jgi:hypothetical protein
MSAEQEQAVAAYLPQCPTDFLAVTERFWQDKHSNHLAQKRLANAYLKHRDHTQVKPLLIEAAQRWMGFVHIRGQLLERGSSDRNAEQIVNAMRDRCGAPIIPGEITFHGIPLGEVCHQLMAVI